MTRAPGKRPKPGLNLMIQLILRGMFIVMTAAVAGLYAIRTFTESANAILLSIIVALVLIFGTLLIKPDGLFGRKKVVRL